MDEPFCVLVLSWLLFNPFTVSFVSAIISVLVAYLALGGVQIPVDAVTSNMTSTTPSVAFIQLTTLVSFTTIKYPVDNTILGNLSDAVDEDSASTSEDVLTSASTAASTARTEVPESPLESSIDTFKLYLIAIIAVATFLLVFIFLNALKHYYRRRRRTPDQALEKETSMSYDQERHERAPLLEDSPLFPDPRPSGTSSDVKFYGTDISDRTKES